MGFANIKFSLSIYQKTGSIVTFKTQGSLHFGLRREHLAFNSISHEVVWGCHRLLYLYLELQN